MVSLATKEAAMHDVTVGIRSIGCYVPEGIRDSAWIAQASDIPENVVRVKFGIKLIHKAGPEETVSYGCRSRQTCAWRF